MNIWIYRNGTQEGPYTSEQIKSMNLPADTPAWHQGLADWTTLGNINLDMPVAVPTDNSETDAYTGHRQVEEVEATPVSTEQQQYTWNAWKNSTAQSAPQQMKKDEPQPPCPPSYLGWAIAITLCCCTPLGIVAIIYAAKVRERYQRGNYAGARKASDIAQWCIIISIALGMFGSMLVSSLISV